MSNKVILTGHILVPESDLPAVQAALPNHIALTRAEPGCLVFEVSQNSESRCRFDVYEEFIDAAAFDLHQARVRGSAWGEVSAGVERHYSLQGVD